LVLKLFNDVVLLQSYSCYFKRQVNYRLVISLFNDVDSTVDFVAIM